MVPPLGPHLCLTEPLLISKWEQDAKGSEIMVMWFLDSIIKLLLSHFKILLFIHLFVCVCVCAHVHVCRRAHMYTAHTHMKVKGPPAGVISLPPL